MPLQGRRDRQLATMTGNKESVRDRRRDQKIMKGETV